MFVYAGFNLLSGRVVVFYHIQHKVDYITPSLSVFHYIEWGLLYFHTFASP